MSHDQTSTAEKISTAPIEWLIPDHVPKGYVSFLVGRRDAGVREIAADWTARVSAGAPWPNTDDRADVGNVLYFPLSETPEHTTVPRLVAASAKLERVFLEVISGDDRKHRSLGKMVVGRLEQTDVSGLELVIVDDLGSFNGREQFELISELGVLARDMHVAVLVLVHEDCDSVSSLQKVPSSLPRTPETGPIIGVLEQSGKASTVFSIVNELKFTAQVLAFRVLSRIVRLRFRMGFIAWEEPEEGLSIGERVARRKTASERAFEVAADILKGRKEMDSALYVEEMKRRGVPHAKANEAAELLGYSAQHRGGTGGRWVKCHNDPNFVDTRSDKTDIDTYLESGLSEEDSARARAKSRKKGS